MSARELILTQPIHRSRSGSVFAERGGHGGVLERVHAPWHPAVLQLAGSPPRVASPYDHEQPIAGNVYAVPESPPLVLPDDWDERIVNAGAIAFR